MWAWQVSIAGVLFQKGRKRVVTWGFQVCRGWKWIGGETRRWGTWWNTVIRAKKESWEIYLFFCPCLQCSANWLWRRTYYFSIQRIIHFLMEFDASENWSAKPSIPAFLRALEFCRNANMPVKTVNATARLGWTLSDMAERFGGSHEAIFPTCPKKCHKSVLFALRMNRCDVRGLVIFLSFDWWVQY